MASAAPEITVAPDASPATVAPSQTPASKPAAKKVAVAPPGYKLVKVRKPDGSIVTVKRKLSPEELAATSAATSSSNATTTPAASPNNATTTPAASPNNATTTPAATSNNATTTKPASSPSNATATTTNTGSTPEAKALIVVPKSPVAPSSPAAAKSPLVEAEAASPLQTEVSQAALDEQAMAFREKRMARFKNGMIRGLANVVAHSVPGFEIGEFHDGDEEVDFGSDMDSDFDPDDDDDEPPSDDHHQDGEKHVQFESGIAVNAAAAAMTAPAQHPVAQPGASQPPGKNAEKETYKLNIKELNAIEEAVEDQQPLRRHWANVTFYIMASLSIMLPILFMILGIFIIMMNKKSTTKGQWHKIPDAIKVAVSAWPIVFAAVVAQVFKAFATFRVERGIKLMQLEQLMGSNSFGNAMKQPLLLRRLDILTLTLFLVWCLSPLGSQAVQRCFYTTAHNNAYLDRVYYVDTTGPNQMFRSDNTTNSTTNPGRATQMQLLSTYYNAAFLPQSQSESNHQNLNNDSQDRYDNPLIPVQNPSAFQYTSVYGIPFFLPENMVTPKGTTNGATVNGLNKNYKNEFSDSDLVNFNISASYYNLKCGNWSQMNGLELENRNFATSFNAESGFTMTPPSGQNNTHYLAFASQNRIPLNTTHSTDVVAPLDTSMYSMIECTYEQQTATWEVTCLRDDTSGSGSEPQCANGVPTVASNPNNYALVDFSLDYMTNTATGGSISLTSPTERFLVGGTTLDLDQSLNPSQPFNLSVLVSQSDFEVYFAFAFNTWVTLGFCPECISSGGLTYYSTANDYLYKNVSGYHQYVDDGMYLLAIPWLVLYWFCCATLLIAGAISVWLESVTVAPDVMGYASSVARNSKYLHLPKTNSTMSAGQRLQKVGAMEVMMQDVKADKNVGKIALGMKHDNAKRLQPNRLYR